MLNIIGERMHLHKKGPSYAHRDNAFVVLIACSDPSYTFGGQIKYNANSMTMRLNYMIVPGKNNALKILYISFPIPCV